MTKIAAIALLVFSCIAAPGQNTIGLPDIINYSKQAIKAGAQNRQIKQDKRGVMYFANNEGLLSFDGINWKLYPLPNRSIVRSIEFGPDNKLYVGGQDEFGYFSPNANGQLQFHSLKSLLPAGETSFTDVWEIVCYRDWIFFQTSNSIYQLSEGGHATVYKSGHWRFLSLYNNHLIAQDYEKGLLSFENGVWAPFLKESELPADYYGSSVITIGRDSALLTTVKNGMYLLAGNRAVKFKTPGLESLWARNISSVAMVNENHIAVATNLDGCYVFDKQGNLVQSFTRKEGLQNNNILDIFVDREKNLWLGLDNGIDFIAYNNAIRHIYPDYLNEGSGYAAAIYNNQLYIGTSLGLYKVPLYEASDISYVKGVFEPVQQSRGQVWNLSRVNGKLLMGHHEGAFLIEGDKAMPIDGSSGFWTFQPYYNILPSSLVITGTYKGINFYDFAGGRFVNKNIRAEFESARFVVIDNDNIWVAHPYKGIYRVQLNNGSPSTRLYTRKEGVADINGNYLFKIKNRIILTTENGIFEYNANSDKFEPSIQYNALFGKKAIRYMKEDAAGNIWFVYDKILGVADMSGDKPHIIHLPELTNKFVSGFEFVYPINKNNVLIGGEKGFYHINYEQYKKIKYPLEVQITMVKAINNRDSLLFGGYFRYANEDNATAQMNKATIGHAWNSFHFEFAGQVYGQQPNIEYSYILEGFEDKWADFSRKTEKEYTNLPAGKYVFKVKARNNLGNESAVSSYAFTVLPPWYLSRWAYAVYIFMTLLAAWLLYQFQRKKFRAQQLKHEEEQKRLQYLHQLEMEKAEKELMALRNAKLESEIQHKTTELASAAMHLVQKGELLSKVKEQMLRLKKVSDNDKESDEVKKLIRAINDEHKMDEQWEQFAMHFDKVHSDFLVMLKIRYPKLSANELKLCAYLRMNLTTKEIAQLMNISVRGVEISRYRLRKKLQVPAEANLFNFLMEAAGQDVRQD